MSGSQALKPKAERAKEGSNFEVDFMLSGHAEYVKSTNPLGAGSTV